MAAKAAGSHHRIVKKTSPVKIKSLAFMVIMITDHPSLLQGKVKLAAGRAQTTILIALGQHPCF